MPKTPTLAPPRAENDPQRKGAREDPLLGCAVAQHRCCTCSDGERGSFLARALDALGLGKLRHHRGHVGELILYARERSAFDRSLVAGMWRRELSRSLFLLLLTCRDQLADLIGAKLRDRLTPLIDSLTGDSERVRKLSDRVVEMGKDVAGFHRDPF